LKTIPNFLIAIIASTTLAIGVELKPADLRCEYRENPLGIDSANPRLSWMLDAGNLEGADASDVPRGIRQTGYHILVASSEEQLARGEGDLWDSGKVAGDRTSQIDYAGRALKSHDRCHWQVRVWTVSNNDPGQEVESAWSMPALWTMGLLEPDDWSAEWIGYDAAYTLTPEEQEARQLFHVKGLQWQHLPGGVIGKEIGFRKEVEIPADRTIRRATFALYAYHLCEAAVNGTPIGTSTHWEPTARLNATPALRPGNNVLSLTVRHDDPYPPAVIGRLVIQFEDGDDLTIPVDSSWKAAAEPANGWQQAGFDDSAWANTANGGYIFGMVGDVERVPAPYLRREFKIEQEIRRATVHVTALGAYEISLNGQRVGDDQLTPGWPDFRKRVYYQTYDVTPHLRQGDNAVGAILGDGWYASVLAHHCRRLYYGGRPRFLAQLEIELADGSRMTVGSDGDWKASYGPILHADLLLGCEYDMRLEMPGWDKPGFDDAEWEPVVTGTGNAGSADVTQLLAAAVKDDRMDLAISNESMGGDPVHGMKKILTVKYKIDGREESRTVDENTQLRLEGPGLKILRATYGGASAGETSLIVQASTAEPSVVTDELPAVKLTEPRPGKWTFDLGQNMVGWVRLKVRGEPGQRITIRHGEMINADGTIYTAALRSCTATDFFILSGNGEEILEPRFTFHGFQYIEVTGLTSKPELTDVTGVVVHTPMRRTGNFESSHTLLNQLYSNIIWGQKGNFLEVPTDCPQRDERMGWTGDTQFFAPTAMYNFDGAAFYTRWLEACEDGQYPDGTFPHVIPRIHEGGGATAWGDAAILCTHHVYRWYGDTRVIEDRYASMERYMEWLEGKVNADGITNVGGFGDWLNAGSSAPAPLMDTGYHAHLAEIMAEMAKAIGRDEDADRYAKRHEETKAAFIKAFVQPDGSLKDSGQTGYALAFTMNLLPDELRDKAAEHFVESIKRHNWHLGTGFIGTPRLLPGLSLAARPAAAHRLLLTDTYPSWLFPVKNGATTMWERWNGWTPEGFGDIKMNSFNHYAFGAVGEYLYSGIGGIRSASPGFKAIVIRPEITAPDAGPDGETLTWARTSFETTQGTVVSHWKINDGVLAMLVVVPPNTEAEVHVPANTAESVTESGARISNDSGVKFTRMDDGYAVFRVGSGRYVFSSR